VIAALLLAALTAGTPISVHRAVTTHDAQAQADFDRGLTLLYCYNGEAAANAFSQALQRDPNLAMAAWGEALANGTDLNTGLDEGRFARAHDAVQRAQALVSNASPVEREFIAAVGQRYAGTYADRDADEARYRAAMAALVAAHPLDDDAAMFDAEALLEHLGTDRMWQNDGAQPAPETATALSLIEGVLSRNPNHPMANHLCMHAYDYARDRSAAVVCANRVASWSFDSGEEHLAHMPAHTYIEVGDYAKAIAVSDVAWQLHPQKYAAHDAYTGWSAAMMLGDLRTAELWAARTGQAYNGSDMWATWTRFGQWQRIAKSTSQNEFYAPLARGLTGIHLGAINDARQMLSLYGNRDTDYRWLLESAIDEHDGKLADAVTALNHALAYQQREYGAETLPLFPAGESLGALFYRHGRYADARDAFTATLERYPNDPRALYGLSLSQKQLGQEVSSADTLKMFRQIWTIATPPNLADL
jgi:tetratricopeptide (TPR) repeat protein